jgi:hypothetical protein
MRIFCENLADIRTFYVKKEDKKMKYYVIHVSNGALQVNDITEHSTPEAALVKFHQICAALWNEPTVIKATVKILDEQLDCYQDHTETITHEQAEAPGEATPAEG